MLFAVGVHGRNISITSRLVDQPFQFDIDTRHGVEVHYFRSEGLMTSLEDVYTSPENRSF